MPSQPCILENTRLRYNENQVYTYTGKILVALNPFGPLPGVYGEDVMQKYIDKDVGAKGVDPHVYAMGEASFKHVKRWKTPAALVRPKRKPQAQAPSARLRLRKRARTLALATRQGHQAGPPSAAGSNTAASHPLPAIADLLHTRSAPCSSLLAPRSLLSLRLALCRRCSSAPRSSLLAPRSSLAVVAAARRCRCSLLAAVAAAPCARSSRPPPFS